ncbi:MAG: alpha/beta fold hydrolase [Planctomycetes bacterium]|nr:alpha/beta fold hydrolase [Planctomycetota bacterium]
MTRRRRRLLALVAALAVGVALVNAAAYAHARAFTTFGPPAAARTAPPQALSLGGRLRVLFTGVSLPRPVNARTPADEGLAYETHTVRAADGTRLEVWRVPRAGARAVAVLTHGHGGSKASLLGVARELHALGVEPLLVDLRGAGGSEGDRTSIGVHEALDVEAAVALARALAPGRPLLLHGVSMGAAAALRAVHARGVAPDLLLVEAPFDRLATTVGHRFRAMGLPAWPGARLLLFWGGVQLGFDAVAHAPVEYAASVTCPALVLGGADDPWVRADELRAVAAAMRGPTEVVVADGVGHEALLERRPDVWRAAVGRLLAPR